MEQVPEGLEELAREYAFPEDRVWLRANMIASIDGAITVAGRSGGLGGPADHRIFRLLRGLADVVIAGAQTARAEGYGPVAPEKEWGPLREGRPAVPPLAIISRSLDLDPDSALFTAAAPDSRTILLTAEQAPQDRRELFAERAEVIVAGGSGVDFARAVAELAARGHRRLLCEGGPTVLAQFAAADALDELCLTVSPLLVAGGAARPLNGMVLPEPQRMRLAGALTDDDFLFLRYTRS